MIVRSVRGHIKWYTCLYIAFISINVSYQCQLMVLLTDTVPIINVSIYIVTIHSIIISFTGGYNVSCYCYLLTLVGSVISLSISFLQVPTAHWHGSGVYHDS